MKASERVKLREGHRSLLEAFGSFFPTLSVRQATCHQNITCIHHGHGPPVNFTLRIAPQYKSSRDGELRIGWRGWVGSESE